jgi:hypothetical protein
VNEYVFQVKEITENGIIKRLATDTGNSEVIMLTKDGQETIQGNFVGQYPEIQDYLLNKYQINVPLIYISQLDGLQINNNGSTTWIFNRNNDVKVIVNDIPITILRIGKF